MLSAAIPTYSPEIQSSILKTLRGMADACLRAVSFYSNCHLRLRPEDFHAEAVRAELARRGIPIPQEAPDNAVESIRRGRGP